MLRETGSCWYRMEKIPRGRSLSLNSFLSTEQRNAWPHGVLPGRPGSSTSVIHWEQARGGLQVSNRYFKFTISQCHRVFLPDTRVTCLVKLIKFNCISASLHSKPLTPTTLTNKALPFIKVIEIKSWMECQPMSRCYIACKYIFKHLPLYKL